MSRPSGVVHNWTLPQSDVISEQKKHSHDSTEDMPPREAQNAEKRHRMMNNTTDSAEDMPPVPQSTERCWLEDAGIQAILDHHALPGVQTPGQMFTRNCTTDVQFYIPYNYHHAVVLVWTAVMIALSHLDPHFGSVFAIEAINEPIMNVTLTPNYGT
ncbi:hypothetical protein BDR04DRAFT_1167951, partial [Suillus decipiens]